MRETHGPDFGGAEMIQNGNSRVQLQCPLDPKNRHDVEIRTGAYGQNHRVVLPVEEAVKLSNAIRLLIYMAQMDGKYFVNTGGDE